MSAGDCSPSTSASASQASTTRRARAPASPAPCAIPPTAEAILPSLYTLKKALLAPRAAYLRRREQLEPGFLRSAMELHYYRPTFYRWLAALQDNDQLLHEFPLSSTSVVLDVGAYDGEWARVIATQYDPSIVAFEPDPANLRRLQATVGDTPRVTLCPWGLAGATEQRELAQQGLGSTVYDSSVIEPDARRVEVTLRDVRDAWQTLGLDRVDLMKINIEGGEFDLLERMMDAGLLGQVERYLVQFHEWHPGAYRRRRRIRRALAASHRLAWDFPFLWELWVRR